MGLERLLILTAFLTAIGTIALQGLIGLEKAITNENFVIQLGGSRTTSLDGGDDFYRWRWKNKRSHNGPIILHKFAYCTGLWLAL